MEPGKPEIIPAPTAPQVGLKTPLWEQEPDLWPLHTSQLSILCVYFFPLSPSPSPLRPAEGPFLLIPWAIARRSPRRWNSRKRLR